MPDNLLIILKILWLAFLLMVPGILTLLAALKRRKIEFIRGWTEFISISFLSGFALLSLTALVTAQLGIFSIQLISGLIIIYSLLVFFLYRPVGYNFRTYLVHPGSMDSDRIEKSAPLILSLILVLGALFFLRPTEYIFGGWDPGVYINTAVHIEKTGEIVIEDPSPPYFPPKQWANGSEKHSAGYPEKYPGFRRAGPNGTRLLPQFYHLFPALLAISYFPSQLEGIFYLVPILGLCALIAVFLAVSELMDRKIALVAVFLLAINMAEIWHARFPVTEILSQFLFFSGLFLLARFLKWGEIFPARLAGTIFGILILSRVSALLIFLPLVIFFYGRWFLTCRRRDLGFIIPLLILTAYSLISGLYLGEHYIKSAFVNFQGAKSIWLYLIPVGAAGVLRAAPKRIRRFSLRLFRWRGLRWALVVIIIALVIFGYFIRPDDPSMSADRTNLVELSWLLTLPGIILSIAGICFLILENRQASNWFFILVILSFAGVFLYRQLIHPYYMWAARRYMVVVVPGFLICTAWFLARLGRAARGAGFWIAAILFLVVVGAEISDTRVLLKHQEYKGAVKFMDRLSELIRDGDLIMMEGKGIDKLPTPLHLICDFTVFPIYQSGAKRDRLIAKLIPRLEDNTVPDKEKPIVYLITEDNPSPVPGIDFKFKDEISYHAILLERSGTHLPSSLDDQAPDGSIKVKIFQLLPD